MLPAVTEPALTRALATACAEAGIDAGGAQLIHHYTNAVYLLPAEAIVARIAHSSGRSSAARTAVDVTGWLVACHDFPATRPVIGAPVVHVDDQTVVTFWVYCPQPEPAPTFTSTDLAVLLRRLHDLPPPPYLLPEWTPLTSLEATVRTASSAALADEDRDWILAAIDRVRAGLATLSWPLGHGMIHGDAWAGNLLAAGRGAPTQPLLADWDGLAHGPREIDLAPTWHAATRYGRGADWARDFSNVYGHDLAAWPGYPLLMHLRDLMQLTGPLRRALPGTVYEHALRQRLTSLRTGDPEPWIAL